MSKVVKVFFINSNRSYYFSNNNLDLHCNDKVVVESDKGVQIGVLSSNVLDISDDKLFLPLKNVLRLANEEDLKKENSNINLAKKALKDARDISKKIGLKMNIMNASFSLDKSQLLFNFIADDRIDFRELAKKLASIYKTRIELRQIGVRDKAKSIGGLGPCGRFLCCSSFLNDFESVSINMAKNQYISLKPDKINGICGRLLCCLNYEDDQYTEMKKEYPPLGFIYKTKEFSGKVVSHNILSRYFTIETIDKIFINVSLDDYERNK